MSDGGFGERYLEARPRLETIKEQAVAALQLILSEGKHGAEFRPRLSEARVKEWPSLRAKAAKQGWSIDEAFANASDLIGLRVVCFNLEDMPPLLDRISSSGRFRLRESPANYVENPKPSGYRAVHMDCDFLHGRAREESVRVEIQLRTLFQDAWGVITHEDVYKPGVDVPAYLNIYSQRLAELLAVADSIASDIRREAFIPVPGAPPADGNNPLSPASLASLFESGFGSPAPGYVITSGLAICKALGIDRVEPLAQVIQDQDFRSTLAAAYEEEAGWPVESDLEFELLIGAAGGRRGAAVEAAKARGRADRISNYFNSVVAAPPATIEDLADTISADPTSINVIALAREWGALRHCERCGEDIIVESRFVEAALECYEIEEDPDSLLETALSNSGLETDGLSDGGFCNYCQNVHDGYD